jgi:hypothetical protein
MDDLRLIDQMHLVTLKSQPKLEEQNLLLSHAAIKLVLHARNDF